MKEKMLTLRVDASLWAAFRDTVKEDDETVSGALRQYMVRRTSQSAHSSGDEESDERR